MTKPFIVTNVREILDLYDKEEISFSRMVEMLNEIAAEFYEGNNTANDKKDCNTCLYVDLPSAATPCVLCGLFELWQPGPPTNKTK